MPCPKRTCLMQSAAQLSYRTLAAASRSNSDCLRHPESHCTCTQHTATLSYILCAYTIYLFKVWAALMLHRQTTSAKLDQSSDPQVCAQRDSSCMLCCLNIHQKLRQDKLCDLAVSFNYLARQHGTYHCQGRTVSSGCLSL